MSIVERFVALDSRRFAPIATPTTGGSDVGRHDFGTSLHGNSSTDRTCARLERQRTPTIDVRRIRVSRSRTDEGTPIRRSPIVRVCAGRRSPVSRGFVDRGARSPVTNRTAHSPIRRKEVPKPWRSEPTPARPDCDRRGRRPGSGPSSAGARRSTTTVPASIGSKPSGPVSSARRRTSKRSQTHRTPPQTPREFERAPPRWPRKGADSGRTNRPSIAFYRPRRSSSEGSAAARG